VLVEIRDKAAALKKQGRSLPEVIEAKPGARYDTQWGNLFMSPSAFLALVYQGIDVKQIMSPSRRSRCANWRH